MIDDEQTHLPVTDLIAPNNAVGEQAPEAMPATLNEGALRELINARVVTGFVARGSAGGFVLEATLGSEPGRFANLGNTRGGPRVFASLKTVALLVKRFGFNQLTVDVSGYAPGRVRASRPDRSAAMKEVMEKVVKKKVRPLKKSAQDAARKRSGPRT